MDPSVEKASTTLKSLFIYLLIFTYKALNDQTLLHLTDLIPLGYSECLLVAPGVFKSKMGGRAFSHQDTLLSIQLSLCRLVSTDNVEHMLKT